jgi:hypothetical protein
MPAYLYGLGSNTAARFFYDELNDFALRGIPHQRQPEGRESFGMGGAVATIVSTCRLPAFSQPPWRFRYARVVVLKDANYFEHNQAQGDHPLSRHA